MTTTTRERTRTPARPARRGPSPTTVALVVCRAGGTAFAAGLLATVAVAVLTWAADPRSGAGSGEALRAGALTWLVAHGARLAVRGGAFGLAPLTLTLLLAWLPFRAGARVVRELEPRPLGRAAWLGAAVAVPYAVLATLLTGPAGTPAARPGPWRVLLCAGALAALAGALGGIRARGPAQYLDALPQRARLVGGGAAAALLTLAAGGAFGVAAALLWHLPRAAALMHSLRPGLVGTLLLVLLCVAYAPNAVVWCVAFATGTGFAVGTATAVAPTGVTLGPLPAFPLLATLPGSGAAPAPALLLLAVPLAAGVVAGVHVARRDPALVPARAAGWAFLTGPVAGAAAAVACVLASGPAGPGRLAVAGPNALVTALAVAEWVGFAAAAAAAVTAWRR